MSRAFSLNQPVHLVLVLKGTIECHRSLSPQVPSQEALACGTKEILQTDAATTAGPTENTGVQHEKQSTEPNA